jgi:hypothetical protein
MTPPADGGETPFRYNLELTPTQLKVTYDALRAELDRGELGAEIADLLAEVLAKLPEASQMDSIRLPEAPEPADGPADEPPDVVA